MKKTKSVSDRTLELIDKKGIRPIPRWEFVAINWGLWIMSVVSVVAGAVAVAVAVYMTNSNDWDLYYFPYFWLVILLMLAGVTYGSVRNTKKGYKLELMKIFTGVLVVSLIGGLGLNLLNVGEKVDRWLAADIPAYRQVAPMKYETWMRPEEGMLAGGINKISEGELILTDLNGKKWKIVISSQTTVRMRVMLAEGEEVKIIGKMLNKNVFEASEIRPWLNRYGY